MEIYSYDGSYVARYLHEHRHGICKTIGTWIQHEIQQKYIYWSTIYDKPMEIQWYVEARLINMNKQASYIQHIALITQIFGVIPIYPQQILKIAYVTHVMFPYVSPPCSPITPPCPLKKKIFKFNGNATWCAPHMYIYKYIQGPVTGTQL